MDLKKFNNNIQSQFGEDGVIEEIFKRIGTKNSICVEFGAWDGIHFSNTWNLWHNLDWTSYLIEGDTEKVKTLEKNILDFPKATAINRYVMPEGEYSLDDILSDFDIPENFDLLSIDIDSDDYYIFEKLNNYSPRLILVEFNPTIPPHIEVIQKPGEYFGCSALALLNLAKKKNYKLAHITDTNLFLVREDEFSKLNIEEVNILTEFPFKHLTHVITSYDGRMLLTQMPVYVDKLKAKNCNKRIGIFKLKKSHTSTDTFIDLISDTELIQVSIYQK